MKVWEYPIEKETVDQLVSTFPNLRVAPDVKEHVKRIERNRMKLLELKEIKDVDINVPFADKLRNYQRVGANFLSTTGKCILADDMVQVRRYRQLQHVRSLEPREYWLFVE